MSLSPEGKSNTENNSFKLLCRHTLSQCQEELMHMMMSGTEISTPGLERITISILEYDHESISFRKGSFL